MPSTLPTESTLPKQVDTWGIGTFDSQRDEEGDHGENSEAHEPAGRTLPDDSTKSPQIDVPGNGAGDEEWLSYPNEPESRTVSYPVSSDIVKPKRKAPLPRGDAPPEEDRDEGSMEVFNPDRNLSYPDSADARLGHADLPGDADGNFQHFHPKTDNYDAVVESSASEGSILPQEQGVDGRDPGSMQRRQRKKTSAPSSELPTDGDNPAARTDYYDDMHPVHSGSTRQSGFTDYVAPTGDDGAYTSQKKKNGELSELPTVMKNEETMENTLQPLGNWEQGIEIEDVSNPYGFPATDFNENLDFDRSDNQDGGTQLPGGDVTGDRITMFASEVSSGRTSMRTRQATNINQVIALTKDFLKEAGKEDLTKRHVLSFLQSRNLPQYLSSDIIRCLKLSHDIHVKDVLDEFPVARKASAASQTSIARVRQGLIALECKYVRHPEVASVFRRCAANLTRVILDMERLERRAAEDPYKEGEKCFDDHVKESTKAAYEAYCKGCEESGQPCLTHDEWLKGMQPEDDPGEPTSKPHHATQDQGDPTKDWDDYAPAHGHAQDDGAWEAYRDYKADCEHEGREPRSFEDFKRGKK